MRLGLIAAAAVTALVLPMAATAGASAAPLADDTKTVLPYTLTIKGANGSALTQAQIPEGATPVALTGTIASTYTTPGTLNVSINGRSAATVESIKGGQIDVPLSASDINESAIPIGLSARLESTQNCFAEDNATATLSNAAVTYRFDSPQNIATIGDFLSPGIPSYTVVVPTDASTDEQAASLTAVAALSHAYPPPTKVALAVTDSPAQPDFFNRQVRISAAADAGAGSNGESSGDESVSNSLSVSGPVLSISGSGAGLSAGAAALSNPDLGAISTTSATDVSDPDLYQPVPFETTLNELDPTQVRLEGIGTQTVDLAINQPSFGSSLEAVEIRLDGAMTEVQEGGQGRVDYLWNGDLVDSTPMGQSSKISNTLKIPAESLGRTNTLGISMSYAPPGADCSPKPLGARADLGVSTTAVYADPGVSLPAGFERHPQVFEATVPVTYLNNGPTPADLVATANLVASLERNWPLQHVYQIESPEDFKNGDAAGIAVGYPDEQDGPAVFTDAPLSSDTNATQLGPQGADLQVTSDTAYAYLQAYFVDGRNIIMLGTHAAGNEAAALTARDELAAYVNDNPNGWVALTNQVVTKLPGGQPQTLTITQPPPEPSLIPYLFATAIVLILLAALLLAWLWRRPKGSAPELPGNAPGNPASPKTPGNLAS